MRYKQGYNAGMLKAVREYHELQRSKAVRVIRWVVDPTGDAALLVRFKDEGGRELAGLYGAWWDSCYERWDITEQTTCNAKDEHEMVQGRMYWDCDDLEAAMDEYDELEE